MAEATKKNDALSRDVTEKQTELDAKLAELGKREEEDERRKHEATEKLQDLAAEIANLRGQREILLAKLDSLQDRIDTDSDEGVSGSGRESAGEPSLEQVAKIAEKAKQGPAKLIGDYRRTWDTADPRELEEKLTALVGLEESDILPIIRNGVGFDSWSRLLTSDEIALFGIVEQQTTHLGGLLAIVVSRGKVVDVVARFSRFVLVKLPSQSDWDRWSTAALIVSREEGRLGVQQKYAPDVGDSWTWLQVMTAFDTEVQTAQQIYGTDKPILVLGLEQLEQTHPDIFAAWAAQEDYQGRPKANLAMVKRSKSFSAGAIVEGVRFPAESLKQKFQALVEAAVNRRRAGIGPLLSPALGSEVLGEIGAVALSEGFQVQGIRSDPADTPVQAQVADQGLPPVDRAEIFTGYREKLREDRQVIAVFAFEKPKESELWRLAEFSKRVVAQSR